MYSCNKKQDANKPFELNTHTLTLKPGDTATLTLLKNIPFDYELKWGISDKNVINEYSVDSISYSFTAENEGKSTIYIKIPELNEVDSCVVTVGKSNLVRILAIGNSFSEDALEEHLYNLASASNKQIMIGNLYIGGSSLSDHIQNVRGNLPNYSYRKIEINGIKITTEKTSIYEALNDEYWDYISFQQVSYEGGIYSTFEKLLPELYDYVSKNNPYYNTKYLLHQTWAYGPKSNHQGFKRYDNDQVKMYEALVSSYDKAKKLIPIYRVIPSGTAIQNARNTSLGNDLTRDGYHLSLDKGRYIASCTWFEALFRTKIESNTYRITSMTENEIAISKWAAHAAIIQPLKVTKKQNSPF